MLSNKKNKYQFWYKIQKKPNANKWNRKNKSIKKNKDQIWYNKQIT
jgi:hypothetical protein